MPTFIVRNDAGALIDGERLPYGTRFDGFLTKNASVLAAFKAGHINIIDNDPPEEIPGVHSYLLIDGSDQELSAEAKQKVQAALGVASADQLNTLTDNVSSSISELREVNAQRGVLHINYPAQYSNVPHAAGGLNGIIDIVGKAATGSFVNPHTSGALVVTYSALQTGNIADLVGKNFAINLHTQHVNGAWIRIDFGATRKVKPSAYTIGKATDYPNYYLPKNWVFEGSDDNTNWTVLDTRTNDNTMLNASSGSSSKFICATPSQDGFRYVRWRVTGLNASGDGYYFKTGPVDIFGDVSDSPALPSRAKGWIEAAPGAYVPYY